MRTYLGGTEVAADFGTLTNPSGKARTNLPSDGIVRG